MKRKRSLEASEILDILSIIENHAAREEFYVGAYILLENYIAAKIHFDMMPNETKKIFLTYPIFHLWKQYDKETTHNDQNETGIVWSDGEEYRENPGAVPELYYRDDGRAQQAEKAIDFDQLRQVPSSNVMEGDEACEFTWDLSCPKFLPMTAMVGITSERSSIISVFWCRNRLLDQGAQKFSGQWRHLHLFLWFRQRNQTAYRRRIGVNIPHNFSSRPYYRYSPPVATCGPFLNGHFWGFFFLTIVNPLMWCFYFTPRQRVTQKLGLSHAFRIFLSF